MLFTKTVLIIAFSFVNLTFGLYIQPTANKKAAQTYKTKTVDRPISDSQWMVFKSKLGLTDQKVQLLKSQKDQKATADLIKQFIKENPKYITVPHAALAANTDDASNFHQVYQGLIKQLQAAKGPLKASLNFELPEDKTTTQKQLKRTRRKIAFKMVSDIPTEKIDDLLKMFSEQHGLNKDEESEDNEDYNEIALPPAAAAAAAPTTSGETDYAYENLWEDEEDQHMVNPGPQFGSFQDLIMQASQQRMQRELEETKLNKHLV